MRSMRKMRRREEMKNVILNEFNSSHAKKYAIREK